MRKKHKITKVRLWSLLLYKFLKTVFSMRNLLQKCFKQVSIAESFINKFPCSDNLLINKLDSLTKWANSVIEEQIVFNKLEFTSIPRKY